MYSSSFIEYDTTIKYKYNHINSKKNNTITKNYKQLLL